MDTFINRLNAQWLVASEAHEVDVKDQSQMSVWFTTKWVSIQKQNLSHVKKHIKYIISKKKHKNMNKKELE